MRLSRKIIVAVGISAIIGSEILYTALLSAPNDIRMHSPEGTVTVDRAFVAAGDAWMRNGIEAIRVLAVPVDGAQAEPISFPAERAAVRYKGKTLFALSNWSTRVTLPSDGAWEIKAVAMGGDGLEVQTAVRRIEARAGTPRREFRSWTPEHLIPLGLILVVSISLGFLARGGRRVPRGDCVTTQRFDLITLVCTILIWINELVYQLYWFRADGWSVANALIIQMCGISILLLPVMAFSERQNVRQLLFDILWFWGIGGALQALIAPDIGTNGFPQYRYFAFFVSHGLIIAMAVIMAMAGGVRITLRSFLRVLVVTNLLLIPVYGLDRLLQLIPPYDQGNYFVLAYPPPSGSVVDVFAEVFGPSPRYVVGLELMGAVVFGILYVPWPIARAMGARKRQRQAQAEG